MGCKLLVALRLEGAHHFIERCASGRSRGFEPPATFGTTKTPKTLLFNPHQFPAHSHLSRCAPALSDRMPSTPFPTGDQTFWFATTWAVPLHERWFVTFGKSTNLLPSPMVARNAGASKSRLFLVMTMEVMVGCPPQESSRTDCCSIDYFLSASATRTANHASAAQIIRVNS